MYVTDGGQHPPSIVGCEVFHTNLDRMKGVLE